MFDNWLLPSYLKYFSQQGLIFLQYCRCGCSNISIARHIYCQTEIAVLLEMLYSAVNDRHQKNSTFSKNIFTIRILPSQTLLYNIFYGPDLPVMTTFEKSIHNFVASYIYNWYHVGATGFDISHPLDWFHCLHIEWGIDVCWIVWKHGSIPLNAHYILNISNLTPIYNYTPIHVHPCGDLFHIRDVSKIAELYTDEIC